jgi:hypothetical protein
MGNKAELEVQDLLRMIESEVSRATVAYRAAKPSKREACKQALNDWQSCLEVSNEIYHSDTPGAYGRIMALKTHIKLSGR